MNILSKLFRNNSHSLEDMIAQRNLRPLGNKKRLQINEAYDCLDFRAQFIDQASAERFYTAFVTHARTNPPPVLIEVILAYTPNTIYSEKFAFILPYFDYDEEDDYKRWLRKVWDNCLNIQRFHSYCSGNDYSYVPISISSKGWVIKWTILPPKGFDLESEQAQVLLSDPPGMGYDAVKIAG